MSKMATQQEVIKAFLRSLDNSTLSGAAAVDEAVRNCSGGKFSSMQNVIDSFVRDAEKYGSDSLWDSKKNVFLEDYCGIILSNDDTGAISGADAGGSYVKTEDSIVQESGAVLSYPSGGTSTINGLTFHWPDRSTLSNDEQAIVDRIYTWWAKGALNLIQESYGMSFVEADASVKDITLRFYSEADDNVLASVSNTYSSYTGKTNKLTLNINMHYYAGFDRQDTNGASSNNTAGYLDRTLAHEFVHAVMAANIDNFSKLPHFVKEGLAELVHGIDDERQSTIELLASKSNLAYVREMFETELQKSNYHYEDAYAGGYMLFRYLAKQSATSAAPVVGLPKGVSYNAAKTAVTIAAPFSGTWDAKDYAATVRTVDASKETNNVTIKAGAGNSTIKAGENGSNIYGEGGNDTIHGGTGKDIFWYGTGDGADTIYNFQNGKDVLHLYNKAQLTGVSAAGWDVTLRFGSGSVRLDDTAGRRIDVIDAAGKGAAYYVGRQDSGNSFVYGAGSRYYGSSMYTDTLKINAAATISLGDTNLYHDIDALDASGATGAVKLTGGAKRSVLHGSVQNDTLAAGAGDAELFGGKGNDTYYGGKGLDEFWWGANLGNDVVYNYESNKDIIAFQAGSLKSGKVSGNDVVLTSNAGNTITLKNAIGKVIVTADVNGKLTRKTYNQSGLAYNANKTVVTIKAPFSDTWDIKNYASTVRTIDASLETNNITIKAGSYNSTIKAGKNGSNIYGQGGNDTIYGGAGKDVFWYGTGDGADTINNFQGGKDVLRFYNKAQLNGVTTSGTNVILKSGNGSVKLNGKANQRVDIMDVNGKSTAYYFGRQDKANSFAYGANNRYYGSAKYNDVLRINAAATVSLANTTLYHDIDSLDASSSTGAVKLTGGSKLTVMHGSAKADTLVAGTGGAELFGGKGNDAYYGGKGKDEFWWGAGLGNDTVYNYESNKDIIAFSAGSLKSGKASGWDVILTANTGNTIRLKNAANKVIVIADTKGRLTRKTYLPSGVAYNANKTAATIQTPYSGTWDAASFANTVRTIDASRDTNPLTIKAGKYNNDIKAGKNGSNIYGQGGNDTIYGGAGKDVFWYGTGDGADTINNFQSGKDVLRFYNKAQLNGVTTSGNNVVLKSGTGSVNLVGKTNQRVDITDINGKNAAYYFGRQDKANTFVYGANQHYYGSAKYKDTLQVNTGATVSLGNTTLYRDIDALDATRSKVAVKLAGGAKAAALYGSAQHDTLTAGSGGATLVGGKGNDTLYGGSGADKFYWGANLGNDTIHNYASGKDVVVFSAGSLKGGKVSGQDVILTSNAGNTLTLKKAAGKAITIQGTDGKQVKKTYKPLTTTSLPAGVTYNSQTMTVKLSKGMVTDFSLAGNDVVLKSTAGNIRIANAKDKILNVVNGNGVKATYKVAANIPTGTGAAYNAGKTEVILGEHTHIDYIFNISNYGDMLRIGNATASKANNCILWGSIYDDVLIAGSGDMTLYGSYGNDKLYGGSGKNDFRWDQNMDNDVIYNYTKGQDRILLEYGKIDGYTVSGNDVILKSGSATLTVKDIKPGELTVYNSFSNQFDTYWYDKKLPNGISYNSAQKQYVLSSSFGNNNSMAALATLPSLSTALDASAVQRPYGFNIWGDNRDNTIIASAGGGLISTGSGKDTVYFGKGKDILSWDNFYEGEITLHGYKKGEDSIKLGYEDKVSRYEMQGNDLVMWNEDTYSSSKLTIKNAKLSDVTILDYSGNEVSISQKSAKLVKGPASGCISTSGKSSLNYVQDVMGIAGKKQPSNLMPLAAKTDSMALAKSLQIVAAQTKKK